MTISLALLTHYDNYVGVHRLKKLNKRSSCLINLNLKNICTAFTFLFSGLNFIYPQSAISVTPKSLQYLQFFTRCYMNLSKIQSKFTNSSFDINFMRFSIVLIFFFFGYSKWFDYEAQALIPLISNSPILSWMYSVFGINGASYLLGTAEWTFGLLIFLGFWFKKIGALGALGSCVTFLTTITFILSTPGAWEVSAGGFPAMVEAAGFLMKDVVLLAGSIVLLKDSLKDKSFI